MARAKEIRPPKGADSSVIRKSRTKAKQPQKRNPVRKDGGVFGHSRKMGRAK